jgi:NAD(P) transhydrogenase subunit alpha
MQIGVPLETADGEARVAVTPETVKKPEGSGHHAAGPIGRRLRASVTDRRLRSGRRGDHRRSDALGAELVLKVRFACPDELRHMKNGAALVGMLNPFDREGLDRLAAAGLTSFALEAAPRTTRAQSMDVLSSQANIAGYKAVITPPTSTSASCRC